MSYVIEDNIIKTEDIDFDFAKLGGLGLLLFSIMKKNEEKLAQIDPESERQDTYGFMLRNAIRTAIAMKNKGVVKGDIILGLVDNDMDAYIPIMASLFLGAIPCNVDPDLVPLEMTNVFNQIKPKMIFTLPGSLERIKDVCRKLKLNPEIVVFGESTDHEEFKAFVEEQEGEAEFRPVVSQDPMETAFIYFSSGTSGLAKACCLSHAYFIKQSGLVPSKPVDNLDEDRRNFELPRISSGGCYTSYAPPYWITSSNTFFAIVFIGAPRLLWKKFNPKQFWHSIEKYRIVMVLTYPTNILSLVKERRPANVNTDSLIRMVIGGSPLPKSHWKMLQDMLPETDIIQSYGLTETGVITSFETYNRAHRDFYRRDPETVGFPIRGIWYKVVNQETDEVLGPNQEGELLVKSKYFMSSFYNQPLETTFDKDGWFRTGDLVYYNENCAFYITDRIKEIMKYNYLTVYPNIIENELLKHPAVAQAVVVGVPDEVLNELPTAFVILNEGFDNAEPEEIRAFVDSRMLDKAKLRGGLRVVSSFPMTSTGKVKRRELRRMILEEQKRCL